jgi:sugar phosphate isomerase/epimerase
VLPAPPIGVLADHFRLPAREAITLAGRMGFEAVELAAIDQLDPLQLSETGRRDLARHVNGQGLQLTALANPASTSAWSPRRIELTLHQTHRILALARQLNVPNVTIELPPVAVEPDSREEELLRQAIDDLAQQSANLDVTLAIASPGTPADVFDQVLRQTGSPTAQATIDPGALLMLGQDPTAVVPHLAGRLAITHLRDALPGSPDAPGYEVPLGKGQLDLSAFLEMLAQAGPPRPVMVARQGGENPVEDLRAARQLLIDLQRPG